MDDQVVKAKEQASSRKEVLDKVEKWKHASQEESWLDEYEKVYIYINTGVYLWVILGYESYVAYVHN